MSVTELPTSTPSINGSVPSAVINGDGLILRDFCERDPDVVELAREADDTEAAIHHCLHVGARAINLAQVSMDSELVEHAFEGMTVAFERNVKHAVEQINHASTGLLDEQDGDLAAALNAWREQVDRQLGAHFDPDSKSSVIGKLDAVFEQASAAQVEAIKRLINPDDEHSLMGRYRAEIVKAVKEETGAVRQAVAEVSEKIAVRGAETKLIDKTAIKGTSYEDLIHEAAARLITPLGDMAEQVGRTTGAKGNQRGDELVTLNPEDTPGCSARYVMEQKDRKVGMNAILNELDAAISNREALAGIAVFSTGENCPAASAFTYNGNRAIVIFDKDDQDATALQLACMWARWVVRRQLADHEPGINPDRVAHLIDDAARALDRQTTIRRCHSNAKKKIDEANSQVTGLVDDVATALDTLRGEITS